MTKRMLAGALAAGACAMCVASADASTLQIGWNTVPGLLGISTLATGTGSGISWTGSLGGFDFNVVSGSDVSPIDFGSTSLNSKSTTGAAGPIYVYVTETDLTTSKSSLTFKSTLTENELSPGWSITETTFQDNSNTPYGMANLLLSYSASTDFDVWGVKTIFTSSPFSLTEMYVITASGAGQALSTEHISSIPELSTWAMMAVGFAGLGFAAFRRARPTISIA